jgi:hypothetical protein
VSLVTLEYFANQVLEEKMVCVHFTRLAYNALSVGIWAKNAQNLIEFVNQSMVKRMVIALLPALKVDFIQYIKTLDQIRIYFFFYFRYKN